MKAAIYQLIMKSRIFATQVRSRTGLTCSLS